MAENSKPHLNSHRQNVLLTPFHSPNPWPDLAASIAVMASSRRRKALPCQQDTIVTEFGFAPEAKARTSNDILASITKVSYKEVPRFGAEIVFNRFRVDGIGMNISNLTLLCDSRLECMQV
jgi:hypothetical protein